MFLPHYCFKAYFYDIFAAIFDKDLVLFPVVSRKRISTDFIKCSLVSNLGVYWKKC